jgi:flagellar basal-body rod protein FlgF
VKGEETMRIGFYAAALGSREQQARLDTISNNIANAGTPGFKKEVVQFHNFMSETTAPNMGQGSIQSTGSPFDIALSGEGFLKVKDGNSFLYTRAGNLKLNRQGMLVTQDELSVVGKNGNPITIRKNMRITENGQVFDDDQNVATLDLVRFPPNTQFTKEKNGYFTPVDPSAVPVPANNCTVRQGNLEEANFNIVGEMTQLIDTMRTFEAYQKMLHTFDQIDSELINKYASS